MQQEQRQRQQKGERNKSEQEREKRQQAARCWTDGRYGVLVDGSYFLIFSSPLLRSPPSRTKTKTKSRTLSNGMYEVLSWRPFSPPLSPPHTHASVHTPTASALKQGCIDTMHSAQCHSCIPTCISSREGIKSDNFQYYCLNTPGVIIVVVQ